VTARVAIVAGLRTPFAKRTGGLAGKSALELGVACVRELLARTGLDEGDRLEIRFPTVAEDRAKLAKALAQKGRVA
jgi:acetyl-CoA acetyltransferase